MIALLASVTLLFPFNVVDQTMGPGTALVVVALTDNDAMRHNPEACGEPLPPCSTFKIWNTAIGLETGVLKEANEPFYKWDGKKRWLDAWNRDLTLREAYQVSCVPAYQELARKIGQERMETWIGKLGYGDRNLSSGLDVFWLPEAGRKPLLISPNEQAALLVRFLKGETPFSPQTTKVLREVMELRKTEKGTLYGKTGTGIGGGGDPAVGWFVGFVEGEKDTFVFAAATKQPAAKEGEKPVLLGPEMRKRVEALLEKQGLL